MANYRGYFKGFDGNAEKRYSFALDGKGILYSVHIGTFSARTYTEIQMAGQSPFVVSYNTSRTPFDPIRTSTAQISIVHNSYLEDILPSQAQETPVYLYNETLGEMEWVGWLSPKELSQNYTEENETLQLEASDCLSILQYLDYETEETDKKKIVVLENILDQIFSKTELISYYYWGGEKYFGNHTTSAYRVLPENIKLSEQNFFTSDTDKPWKLSEVLEQICLYFGYTAMQWKDRVYLVNLAQAKGSTVWIAIPYSKSGGSFSKLNSTVNLYALRELSQEDVRGPSASISFEPIYNRIVVKDNMYTAESFIPSPFDDNLLTNRIDPNNFYDSYVCTIPAEVWPTYPWGSKWYTLWISQDYKKDRIERKNGWRKRDTYWSQDDDYMYYHRPYTHKYWKSCYDGVVSDGTGTQADLARVGGTIMDMGVVRNVYISEYKQTMVPSKLDYTRYICISQQNVGTTPIKIGPTWELAEQVYYPVLILSGYTNSCPITVNSYLLLNCNAIFEKYIDRPYINPDWLNEGVKIGGWDVHSHIWGDGFLNFRLKIGNKYWNGKQWTTTPSVFSVALEDTNKEYGTANEERHVLNNVSYTLGINESGYLIPLSYVDPAGEIEFAISLPSIQFWYDGNNIYNGYCWLKDFDIKVVQAGQDENGSDTDIVYTNVVPTGDTYVNSLSDITFKLTTMNEKAKPSYSNVMYVSGGTTYPVNLMRQAGTGAQKPEEGIIKKYYNQYSTPTKKISMEVEYRTASQSYYTYEFAPFSVIRGIDVESPNTNYAQLGATIDYLYGRETITCVQTK